MTELVRATNVEEAFDALDPFALVRPSDPFFADIEADLPREHYGVSEEDSHLILHSCVLNYDGEPWWDVHPLLRGDPRFCE